MEQSKPDQILKELTSRLEDMSSIIKEVGRTNDFEKAREDLKRWKMRTVKFLKENVSEIEGQNLENKRKASFIMGDFYANLVDEIDMYRGFVVSLAEEIKKHPDEIIIPKQIKTENIINKEVINELKSKTIFIIHGHDEINLLRLKELLRERWHLEPLVLNSEPDTGRTLIEKFEQEAQRASFAIALLSPDDKVKDSKTEYFQARPNGIFELGWFYGRLGREKVCILSKKGTTIHSDLDGIMRKDFEESVEEIARELEIELRKAGLIS